MNRTVKVKTILLVGILLLSVLVVHLNFELFTRYNYVTGLFDKMNNNHQLILIGDTPNDVVNYTIAAREFGFEYFFYGCIVSGPAAQGIKGYNQVMYKALTEKNGPDWENKLLQTIQYLSKE